MNNLRPGGYFILHDYFGWYGEGLVNRSPIKKVADEIVTGGQFENLLIDTGYMSFMLFRKPDVRFASVVESDARISA
jgi:hypothetical protein